jgi:hypothetical protein
MQLEMHSINKRVEQNQLDLTECLKFHHPDSSDNEDATHRTAPMVEDTWALFFVVVFSYFTTYSSYLNFV